MKNCEIMEKKIASVDTQRYDMFANQIMYMAEKHDNNLINGMGDIFKFGFYQGQQQMKNKLKKLQQKQNMKININSDEKIVKLVQKTELDNQGLRGEMIYG